MKLQTHNTPDYAVFLKNIKNRISTARLHAARAVNSQLILLYWDIGRGIVEKQKELGWGEAVIERLSTDLRKEFPNITGFSARNLRDTKRFYEEYASSLIWRQLVADIPWGHHLALLTKVKNRSARLYYLIATRQFAWSRNVLLNQIKADAYGRSLKAGKTHNFPTALPAPLAIQAEESLKSTYSLEFLGVARELKERDLEERLIRQLREFILELGYGFFTIAF